MSSEQEIPQADTQQFAPPPQPISSDPNPPGFMPQGNIPPGQGQSKSSRRRRRKRNKARMAGAVNGQGQPFANGQPASNGEQQPQAEQGEGFSMQGQAQPQNTNGSGEGRPFKKKKKKKFRSGGGSGEPNGNGYANPGNGNGGGRRRNKQRRQTGFVGPMDHSYRETNGNYADSSPSTIEVHGNRGNGHRSQQNYHPDHNFNAGGAAPVPVREDAPTHIYCFIEDLFFIAKIQETARKLGVKVAFLKIDPESIDQLTDATDADRPALIVIDLNNGNGKPLALIPKLKSKFKRGTSLVGFLSHLQGDLKAKASEAGCDTVVPRSAFSQNLPNLLRRYGLEEEEEPNFNN